ncbi:hypothetical protein DYI23_04625 [Roseibium polysiphoniae]|uniref:Secreted protein n=1 Tax=Roseibium polysiphoniae TaxID=2571221 RepID=A0A944CAK2_9HYPH|nr:hypothetical protein [Roseibium polysiphoniae]MBS8259498.1 hypothetical protein [Roseibium polysiphoniae]
MKTVTTHLLTAAASLAAISPALAHSGDHGEVHLREVATHLLSSPFHLAAVAAGGVLLATVIWWRVSKR